MGDFNAKVGKDNSFLSYIMGKYGVGDRNDNGGCFVDFCNARHLVIGATIFEHKLCHRVSWVSPTGRTQNQIDHFAISRRFRGCLSDVRNKRGTDIGYCYDHHLMIAQLRLRTAAIKNNTNQMMRSSTYFTERLKNPEVADKFMQHLMQANNAFEITPSSNTSQQWKRIKEAYLKAGDAVVGKTPRGHRPWMSEESWTLVNDRYEMKTQSTTVSDSNLKCKLLLLYRDKQREVKRSVRRDKRKHIDGLALAAEGAAISGDIRTLYKISKKLTKNKMATERPVRDTNGKLLTSDDEQLERWKSHFHAVLNNLLIDENVPPTNTLLKLQVNSRIKVDVPSIEEIKDAIKALPNNKATGIDGIPAEFYKTQPAQSASLLCPLIQAVSNNEHFPKEWNEDIIVKIPKKGDLQICDNWRGICVLPAVAKIIARVILERVKKALYDSLCAEQAGFRPGSSCTDHINTLRIIIEQSAEYNTDLHVLFIDFMKAFDSVKRDFIWAALRRRNVPDKIISLIRATYENACCRVLHKGKLSDPFDIQSGVRQGCILSPVLFLLVIGDVLEAALLPHRKCGLRWDMFCFLQHLDYADDVCFLAHKIPELNGMVESLEKNAIIAGLKINCSKTKILSLSSNSTATVNISGAPVECVKQFTYLGSEVAAFGGTDEDVKSRIGKARAAFGMLSSVWRNNNISVHTKMRIFKSSVVSVLLYACCTWKVTKSITTSLQVFYKSLPEEHLPHILAQNHFEPRFTEEGANGASRNGHKTAKMEMDWAHSAQERCMHSTKGIGVEPSHECWPQAW